ncbi:MAG: YicC family protein [Deltaproteobacteria bacterium]|nr:MAG: YicC family protein [Deltaproteobacteria bacterium]TNF25977.1 MAG: YicC family protein [Deltaproteobacteria bacterium]
MSLQSMTGYGRGEAAGDNYTVVTEIKSVNHRFKDIRFKMSSMFAPIEMDLKKTLGESFHRGSFDIFINYKRSENNTKFDDIDPAKVKNFLEMMKKATDQIDVDFECSYTDFLRSEFMADQDDTKSEELQALAREAFGKAVAALTVSRQGEGEKMVSVLKDHRDIYNQHYQEIAKQADTFQTHIEERLKKKFQDFQAEIKIDEPRFLQEVVYYLEKMDVHEEINRIKAHLEKFDQLLTTNREVGRQIDFLVQELGRETNTIGSKSSMKEVSDNVVQMKVQLEKIREQGLNLE